MFRVAALIMSVLATTVAADAQTPKNGAPQKQQQPSGEAPAQSNVPKSQEKTFPVPSSWVVVSLNGKPYSGIDRPSFSLDKQYRAKGFGGCNTYSATAYPLREQRFAVGPLALTKKQCDKAVMESERAFLVALRTAMQWDLDGVTLVIRGQSGELRFERAI